MAKVYREALKEKEMKEWSIPGFILCHEWWE